jgi:hypothetical protein
MSAADTQHARRMWDLWCAAQYVRFQLENRRVGKSLSLPPVIHSGLGWRAKAKVRSAKSERCIAGAFMRGQTQRGDSPHKQRGAARQ